MGKENPETDMGETEIVMEPEGMSGEANAHDACETEDAGAMAKAAAVSSESGSMSSASSSSSASGGSSSSASASATATGDILSAEASADCGADMHGGAAPMGFFGFVFGLFGGGSFLNGHFGDAATPFEDTGAGDFEITVSSSSDGDFFF